MDREALLQDFPPAENFNARTGLEKMLAAETAITLVLDAIANDEREPDDGRLAISLPRSATRRGACTVRH